LDVLAHAKRVRPATPTKSGLMLGLGETPEEVLQVMRDLRAHHVDILTLGQYLRPSPKHLPIVRYVPPAEFDEFRRAGEAMGFAHVESGPLVRSSYHAADAPKHRSLTVAAPCGAFDSRVHSNDEAECT
jgi:lipoic acid synthetase